MVTMKAMAMAVWGEGGREVEHVFVCIRAGWMADGRRAANVLAAAATAPEKGCEYDSISVKTIVALLA